MKQSGYLQRLAKQQKERDDIVRDHMRTMILDIVTIALGRVGMNGDDIIHFRDIYMETEEEYMKELKEDFYDNCDKDFVYAKDKIDRALREVVPADMFVPYEERYKIRLKK